MDAGERLRFARRATKEGRYEEALRELVWFHDHALEEQRSLYGVRLSYALHDWVELGRVYPPALQAMREVRERKAQAVLRGEGGFALFHDVVSIDETLGASGATRELYLALLDQQPAFATEHVSLVLGALAKAGDVALLRRVRPDPEAEIRQRAAHMRDSIQMFKRFRWSDIPRRQLHADIYARGVLKVTGISTLIGEHDEARRLQALALDLVHDPSLRTAVRTELAGRAMPPGFGKRRRWRELRQGRRRVR